MTDHDKDPGGGSPFLAITLIAIALATMILAGCTMGPDYKRPEVELPKDFTVSQSPQPAAERWWTLFADPVLDKLVDESLGANRDLKAAAERILQARSQFIIARSDQWPDVGIEGSRSRSRTSTKTNIPLPPDAIESNNNRLVLRAQWELDFWGKYRRATEVARARLAATEAGRDAIRSSLVGDVTRGYFTLRALDSRIEVASRTLASRDESVRLQKLRLDAGVVSELEYRQVESDLRGAQALIAVLRQTRSQQEGVLAVLLGRSPREVFEARIERDTASTPPPLVEVPAGIPSDILIRRPDVRQAEERLHQANAGIGVARAAYFPSITLTGYYGGESQSLGDLFIGPARTWNVAAGLLQPVWESGRIRGGVDLADAQTREAAELYQKAIANAFREVRDAIAAQTNLRDASIAQQQRESALSRTYDLARLRYDNGAVSLFDVLETERALLVVRLEAIDAERDRRNAIVDLYIALGA